MRILGIETSCDETSLAVLELSERKLKLLASLVLSQIKDHAPYGGVVPELAARQHTENLIPLLHRTLIKAKIKPEQLAAIAVTQGPGLITALQVGVETARSLAFAWRKPLIGVNHIAGHLVSPFLTPTLWRLAYQKSTWPAAALVVSGGHTELYLMNNLHHSKLLGKTLDDAVGEAFDKVAKMLGLPYPGGPHVSRLAATGKADAFPFPRPLLKTQGLNFSFAGLKTAVLYTVQSYKPQALSLKLKADLCASFQAAAIDVLIEKTLTAARETKAKSILVSGGVSANQALRHKLTAAAAQLHPKPRVLYPDLAFTGDNAAMIALAGGLAAERYGLKHYQHAWRTTNANANWELWS